MRVTVLSLLFAFTILAFTLAEETIKGEKLSISNSHYSVTIVDEKPLECCPYLKRFTLQILNRKTGGIQSFLLGDSGMRLRGIKRLYLYKNKLIVKGALKRASAISIIDLDRNKLIDFFWCYNPAPSSSRRFLVYKKFVPYHGLPGVLSDVVLVYDLEKPPAGNRVKQSIEEPKEWVGLPIYPEPYAKAKVYILPKQQYWEPGWGYVIASPFLWSEDEVNIVFLCSKCFSHRQTYVVRVNLSLGIGKPRIFELPVKISKEHVKPKYLGGFILDLKRGKEVDCLFSTEQIRWDGRNHIVVKPKNYRLKDEIRLPVP